MNESKTDFRKALEGDRRRAHPRSYPSGRLSLSAPVDRRHHQAAEPSFQLSPIRRRPYPRITSGDFVFERGQISFSRISVAHSPRSSRWRSTIVLGGVGVDDAGRLLQQDAREDDGCAVGGGAADRRSERGERGGEDIGDDQVVGRVAGDHAVIEPGRVTATICRPTPLSCAFRASFWWRSDRCRWRSPADGCAWRARWRERRCRCRRRACAWAWRASACARWLRGSRWSSRGGRCRRPAAASMRMR